MAGSMKAEAVLDHILTAAPDSPGALHLLGIVAFRGRRLEEAMELIERAIALLPGIALFYRNLCEIYRKLSRYDDALIAGQRAVELARRRTRTPSNLSVLHYHRLELGASDRLRRTSARARSRDGRAHFGIAEASLLRGEFRPRVGGIPMALPARQRADPDAADRPAAMGRQTLASRQDTVADR